MELSFPAEAVFIRNRRLYAAADQWAMRSLRVSRAAVTSMTGGAPPATSTTRRCAPSPTASSATCTAVTPTRSRYDESTAWGHRYIHEDLAA